MKLSTFRPEYLPSLEFFWYLMQCDHIILTDHFQYVKRSPINISAPLQDSGHKITIPIRHDHQILPISKKRISYTTTWQKNHFKNIYHHFHNEPFAYYYLPEIEQILYNNYKYLSEYHYDLIFYFLKKLNSNSKIYLASQLEFFEDNNESIISWCKKTSSAVYLYKPNIFDHGWLGEDILKKSNLRLKEFCPFPNAHILTSNSKNSILSFLVLYGPEAGYLIRQYMSNH